MTLQRQEQDEWLEGAIRARASAAAGRARAFQSASRHSQLVRRLRMALPLGAVGFVVLLVLFTFVRSMLSHFSGLTMASLSVSGTKITMDKPHLTSARQDGGGYVMSADRAIEDLKSPNETELENVAGDIGGGKTGLKLSAKQGHFDTVKEVMELWGDVRLRSPDYRVEMTRARFDFKSGLYETHEPLKVVLSTGTTIVADSATAADSASLMTFTGHVKTTIPPSSTVAGPSEVTEKVR